MKTKSIIVLGFFIGGLIFCIGCGPRKPQNFPQLVPCQISVTKDGKPIDKTQATLAPTSNGGEWVTSGLTNSSGIATISTSQGSYFAQGAPEGEFKVMLSRPIEIDLKVSQEDAINMTEEEREKLQEEADRLMEKARIIPTQFGTTSTTPAKITISKEKEIYKIELNDYM